MGMANKENGEQITDKDEQEVKALEVETEVVDRMQKTSESYDRMADIIVSDYPKLPEVRHADRLQRARTAICEPGFETMTNDTFDRHVGVRAAHRRADRVQGAAADRMAGQHDPDRR